jgi:hypothetical protein
VAGQQETPKKLEAFEQYYALGDSRSLPQLSATTGIALRTLERWSKELSWQQRLLARKNEEIAAARAAAKKEAAALARRRLRNAQLLQEAGLAILAKSDITSLSPGDARRSLQVALAMITQGMREERLEMGEATEATRVVPPKPIEDMTDEELKAFMEQLESEG